MFAKILFYFAIKALVKVFEIFDYGKNHLYTGSNYIGMESKNYVSFFTQEKVFCHKVFGENF